MKPNHSKVRTFQPIILASQSKYRKALLSSTQLKFDVISANIDENMIKKKGTATQPRQLSAKLAKEKALAVSKSHPKALVIGADQLCVYNDTIFDKPGNKDIAIQQLQELSGNTHTLYSAVSICKNNRERCSLVETASLTMKALSINEISTYLDLDQPYDSCGSYHFESHGHHLFTEVNGSMECIQGLPLLPLLTELKEQNAYLITP